MNNNNSYSKAVQALYNKTPATERGQLTIDIGQLKRLTIGSEVVLSSLVVTELFLLISLYSIETAIFFSVIVLLVSLVFIPSLSNVISSFSNKANKSFYLLIICVGFLIIHTALLSGLFVEKETIKNSDLSNKALLDQLIKSDKNKGLSIEIKETLKALESVDTGNNQEIKSIKREIAEIDSKINALKAEMNKDLNDFWNKKTKGILNSKITNEQGTPFQATTGGHYVSLARIVKSKFDALKNTHRLNDELRRLQTAKQDKQSILNNGLIKQRLQNKLNRLHEDKKALLDVNAADNLLNHLSIGIYKLFFLDKVIKKEDSRKIFINVTLINIAFLSIMFFAYYLMIISKNKLNKKLNLHYKGPLGIIGHNLLSIVSAATSLFSEVVKNIPLLLQLITLPFLTIQVLLKIWIMKVSTFNDKHNQENSKQNTIIKPHEKKCLSCGKPIKKPTPQQKYCSDNCRITFNNQRRQQEIGI